jgi:hypothetical protein
MSNYGFDITVTGELVPVKFRSTFELLPYEEVPIHRRGIWLCMVLYFDHLTESYRGPNPEQARSLRIRFFNWAVLCGAANVESISTNTECNNLRNEFKHWLTKQNRLI